MGPSVLDKRKPRLMPCMQKKARKLLEGGRARVYRSKPSVIRLIDRRAEDSVLQPLTIKMDPSSKKTVLAVVRVHEERTTNVVSPFGIEHRGSSIREVMTARKGSRTRRRSEKRYQPPRFDGRRRPNGWLPPSLKHRVAPKLSFVNRIRRWAPATALATELVRFDMPPIEDPSISGTGNLKGTLAGYEVREHLLEQQTRSCAYCGCWSVPLQVEPGSKGGGNLKLVCEPRHLAKAAMDVRTFVKDPAALARIPALAKRPLADAAASAARWLLEATLEAAGLPVARSMDGRTKRNRTRRGVPKARALGPACLGEVEAITGPDRPTVAIQRKGRGAHQRTQPNKHGFPIGGLPRSKNARGFGTGDLVTVVFPSGKRTGRVAVRSAGPFKIQADGRDLQGISHRHCSRLQRADGHRCAMLPAASRSIGATAVLPVLKGGVSRGRQLMKMTLIRRIITPSSSIGELSIDGHFECVTLEDPVRDHKIKGDTAIPTGTYVVTIEKSPKFGRDMPHLLAVPNYAGVLIHWGNTAKDTEGCILVGSSKSKNFIGGSKMAFNALFAKLKGAAEAGDELSILICKP